MLMDKKKGMLSKMMMPKKDEKNKEAMDLMSMLGSEDGEEEGEVELPAEIELKNPEAEQGEEEMPEEEMAMGEDLSKLSDEELMAELKKRGLMAKLK